MPLLKVNSVEVTDEEKELIMSLIPQRLKKHFIWSEPKKASDLYDLLEERVGFGSLWQTCTEIKAAASLDYSVEDIGKTLNVLGYANKFMRRRVVKRGMEVSVVIKCYGVSYK